MPIRKGDVVRIKGSGDLAIVSNEYTNGYYNLYVYSENRNIGDFLDFHSSEIEIVEVCEPASEFQLYDTVYAVFPYDDAKIVDHVGCIVHCPAIGRFTIQFEEPVCDADKHTIGHSGCGKGTWGYCWEVPHYFLRHTSEFSDISPQSLDAFGI